MIRLLLLVVLFAWLGWWTAAAVCALPLAYRMGAATTARRSGVAMVRAGSHRILTGRL